MEDFAILTLPADLADLFGCTRVLLAVEELVGDCVFHGAASAWTETAGNYDVPQDAWLRVPSEHMATLEALYVAAKGLRTIDAVAQIDAADARHGAEAKGYHRGGKKKPRVKREDLREKAPEGRRYEDV